MSEALKQKMHTAVQHVDEVVGYGVAGGLTTAPVWISTLTPYLQFIMLLVGIGVGVSTWQLNRVKKKKLESSGKKD